MIVGANKKLLMASAALVDNSWNILKASYPTALSGTKLNTGSLDQLRISSDGTKAIGRGGSTATTINGYTFGTAFDETTISYTNTASVLSHTGFDVKPDGTKLYLASANQDRVYEYTLSTPWNVATATLTYTWNVSGGPFTAGTIGCWSIQFKPDGTKVIFGTDDGLAFASFSLGTPWNLTTATCDVTNAIFTKIPDNSNYSGQCWVDPTGTYISLQGNGSGIAYLITLGTPFDLSSQTARVSYGGSTSMYACAAWKPDGTKRFSTNANLGYYTIVAFNVATPWNTAEVTGAPDASFNTATSPNGDGVSSNVRDVAFSPDGTKAFVLKNTNVIYAYTLGTAWDIATMVYSSVSYSVGSIDARGISVKPDGTLITVASNARRVYSIPLSTAWDLTTAGTMTNVSVSYQNMANCTGIGLNTNDGTSFFIYGSDNMTAALYKFQLTTGYNFSTLVVPPTLAGMSQPFKRSRSITFKPDGLRVWSDFNGPLSYPLTTAWDVATIGSEITQSNAFPSVDTTGVAFNADGSKAIFGGSQLDSSQRVYSQALSPAYNFNGRQLGPIPELPGLALPTPTIYTGRFLANGSKFLRTQTQSVYLYDVSTPYDLRTASVNSSFSSGQTCSGYNFSGDGTKLFGIQSRYIRTWTLSTAYNLSTATYSGQVEFPSYATYCTDGVGFYFTADGTGLYTLCATLKLVTRWNLSAAWNTSTLSVVNTLNVSASNQGTYALFLSSELDRVYVSGFRDVWQWGLTEGNLSTGVYNGVKQISPDYYYFRSIGANDDGTEFYLQGQNGLLFPVVIK